MYNMYPESYYELSEIQDIKNYILGGRGIITLASPTGKHHTYSFNEPRNGGFPEGTTFVYCNTQERIWLYVGMIDANFRFRLTRSSTWGNDCEIVKGIRYLMKIISGDIARTPMKIYHCGACAVCGRRLTDPKSIIRGIGPRCRKKMR